LWKNFEIEVRWIAFPLHPEIPEEGLPLEELFGGRQIHLKQRMAHYREVAEGLGLPLGERTRTYNSRRAQELAKWAEANGKGDEFHLAVFRAYFVEGINIGKIDELAKLAKSIGLPEPEAKTVLGQKTFTLAVDDDWRRSLQMGITGVPTFVNDNQMIVGAQPYKTLEAFLMENNVKRRG